MKSFFVIPLLIMIPEPILVLIYLILKKYFPQSKITLFIDHNLSIIKNFFKRIYNKLFIKNQDIDIPENVISLEVNTISEDFDIAA